MADRRIEEGLHTSQMTEQAVNVELLEWLKRHGANILLVAVLIVLAVRGWFWWQDVRTRQESQLWATYSGTDLPASLIELAEEAEGVGALSELALLRAARTQLETVLASDVESEEAGGDAADTAEGDEDADSADDPNALPTLTAQERADTLDSAESLYRRVLDSTAGTPGRTLLRLQALFGLASVAEMRGDAEAAAEWYRQAEQAASEEYPAWSRMAAQRMTTIDETLGRKIELPTEAQIEAARPAEPESPLGDLIDPGAPQPQSQDVPLPPGDESSTGDSPAEGESTGEPQDDPAALSTDESPADQPESDTEGADEPASGADDPARDDG